MDAQTINTALPVILIFLLLFYLIVRRKKRGQTAAWAVYDIAYAHYSEPAEDAAGDFGAAFGAMFPNDPTDVTLLRLSLMNRGERDTLAADFTGPVEIALPEESRILEAAAVEASGRAVTDGVTVSERLNTLSVAPFDLPSKSSVIFNIVVDGRAEPLTVTGALNDQPAISRLGAGDRR
jgi:hypothetical protein